MENKVTLIDTIKNFNKINMEIENQKQKHQEEYQLYDSIHLQRNTYIDMINSYKYKYNLLRAIPLDYDQIIGSIILYKKQLYFDNFNIGTKPTQITKSEFIFQLLELPVPDDSEFLTKFLTTLIDLADNRFQHYNLIIELGTIRFLNIHDQIQTIVPFELINENVNHFNTLIPYYIENGLPPFLINPKQFFFTFNENICFTFYGKNKCLNIQDIYALFANYGYKIPNKKMLQKIFKRIKNFVDSYSPYNKKGLHLKYLDTIYEILIDKKDFTVERCNHIEFKLYKSFYYLTHILNLNSKNTNHRNIIEFLTILTNKDASILESIISLCRHIMSSKYNPKLFIINVPESFNGIIYEFLKVISNGSIYEAALSDLVKLTPQNISNLITSKLNGLHTICTILNKNDSRSLKRLFHIISGRNINVSEGSINCTFKNNAVVVCLNNKPVSPKQLLDDCKNNIISVCNIELNTIDVDTLNSSFSKLSDIEKLLIPYYLAFSKCSDLLKINPNTNSNSGLDNKIKTIDDFICTFCNISGNVEDKFYNTDLHKYYLKYLETLPISIEKLGPTKFSKHILNSYPKKLSYSPWHTTGRNANAYNGMLFDKEKFASYYEANQNESNDTENSNESFDNYINLLISNSDSALKNLFQFIIEDNTKNS